MSDIAALSKLLTDQFAQVNRRLDSLDSHFKSLDERVTSLEQDEVLNNDDVSTSDTIPSDVIAEQIAEEENVSNEPKEGATKDAEPSKRVVKYVIVPKGVDLGVAPKMVPGVRANVQGANQRENVLPNVQPKNPGTPGLRFVQQNKLIFKPTPPKVIPYKPKSLTEKIIANSRFKMIPSKQPGVYVMKDVQDSKSNQKQVLESHETSYRDQSKKFVSNQHETSNAASSTDKHAKNHNTPIVIEVKSESLESDNDDDTLEDNQSYSGDDTSVESDNNDDSSVDDPSDNDNEMSNESDYDDNMPVESDNDDDMPVESDDDDDMPIESDNDDDMPVESDNDDVIPVDDHSHSEENNEVPPTRFSSQLNAQHVDNEGVGQNRKADIEQEHTEVIPHKEQSQETKPKAVNVTNVILKDGKIILQRGMPIIEEPKKGKPKKPSKPVIVKILKKKKIKSEQGRDDSQSTERTVPTNDDVTERPQSKNLIKIENTSDASLSATAVLERYTSMVKLEKESHVGTSQFSTIDTLDDINRVVDSILGVETSVMQPIPSADQQDKCLDKTVSTDTNRQNMTIEPKQEIVVNHKDSENRNETGVKSNTQAHENPATFQEHFENHVTYVSADEVDEASDASEEEEDDLKSDLDDQVTSKTKKKPKTSNKVKGPDVKVPDDLKCPECDKVMRTVSGYKRHMWIHWEDRPRKTFTCQFCFRVFNEKASLTRHERKHTMTKKRECTKCDRVFDFKYDLMRHIKEEHPIDSQEPCICSTCGKSFGAPWSLKMHEKSHKNNTCRSKRCKFCEERFSQMPDLREHMKTHEGQEYTFICNVCESKFTTRANLYRHLAKQHPEEKPFECEFCGERFRLSGDCNTHERVVHLGEKVFQCETCELIFNNRAQLDRHITKKHTGVEKYVCKQCGKAMSSKQMLVNHERLHTGEKPFQCTTCGAAFSSKVSLYQHNRRHQNLQTYSCPYCPSTFNDSNGWRMHIKRHLNDKDNECPHCEYKSVCSYTMKEHIWTHTGEKPFQCSACGYRFAKSGTARRHIKRRHGGVADIIRVSDTKKGDASNVLEEVVVDQASIAEIEEELVPML